jgi:hypothetical protein
VNFAGDVPLVFVVTTTRAWSDAFTRAPFGGLPEATAMFVKFLITDLTEQLYVREPPGARAPRLRLQPGASESETLTAVRRTFPVFVTLIVKCAVPCVAEVPLAPLTIFVVRVWSFGLLTIAIRGFDGGVNGLSVFFAGATAFGGVNGAVTVTGAVSVAETFAPEGGVPVAVAELVRPAVTPARVQL